MRAFLKALLPAALKKFLKQQRARLARRPAFGAVRWGSLRRTTPISRRFGFDEGLPIDRFYIERFLERHRDDVRGRVLEVADAEYTKRFGGAKVERSDVLHAVEGAPGATIVGDLATGKGIPEGAFDCAIVTQTLPFVFDVRGAVRTLARSLKPGGVALVTFAGISPISRYDMDRWGEFWRFTSLAAKRLFSEEFPHVEVEAHGNVLAAVAFLHGLAAEELEADELQVRDPDYELLLTVRARRAAP